MSRRTLPSVLGVATVAVSAALLHASPAFAAPTATLVVTPDHGTPGTSLSATVTLTECTATAVSITGSYVDVDGEDATTAPVAATAGGDPATWNATLEVPDDAARSSLSEEPVTFTANVTCEGGATPSGTDTVEVDDLAEPTVTTDPDAVAPGDAFEFSITGCTGGLADIYFVDGDGNDYDVPESAVSEDSATAYSGTYTVPGDAVAGDGGLGVECTQAASSGADVTVLGAEGDGGGAGEGGAAPPADPVDAVPTFTG